MLKNFFKKKAQCLCQAPVHSLSSSNGRMFRIKSLEGDDKTCERLREMGFWESGIIEKVAHSGAVICKIGNTKVILSQELADKILVKEICPCKDHDKEQTIVLLSQMAPGQNGVVDSFTFQDEAYERIAEMGITPGEEVQVVRFAPLGDPIEIKVRGYLVSLRRQEADRIKVRM